MGNARVERAKLSPGFIPLGVKEYGGIIYVASYNPDTLECEVGSFPSPERDITGSTDIENQTGLIDGHFHNDDYQTSISKISEDYIPEEIKTKIQKLNEEEVLQLNPGDKFLVTHDIKPGTGSGVPINTSNFQDFFSWDDSDKKTFHVNFYKIDSSNNIIELEDGEIQPESYTTGLEEEDFQYYTQASAGTIAVEASLNDITYFNSNMRETSRPGDVIKKVKVEAIGESDSDIEFKGVRVDMKSTKEDGSEEELTFHLENQGNTNKVEMLVEDFEEGDDVFCEITPYHQYGYSPTLSQMMSLKIGQGLTSGSVIDVFKWNVDGNNRKLELDFDFKYQTENQLKMYLEFYDVWSNVSTFRTISTPSVYGTMRVVMDLVNENKTTVFNTYNPDGSDTSNSKFLGGIPFSKVKPVPNPDGVRKAALSDRNTYDVDLERTDGALRMNNFYIVRICAYEERVENNTVVVETYEAYKALYTNTIFNDLYDQQRNLSLTDPNYKGDFTKVPYPLEKIGYSATVNPISGPVAITSTSNVTLDPEIKWTDENGVLYPYHTTQRPTPNGRVVGAKREYKVSKNFTIKTSRPEEWILGELVDETLEISGSDTNIELEDTPLGQTDFMNMNSVGYIEIDNDISGSNNYPVTMHIETERGIEARVVHDDFTGSIKRVYLNELLYKNGYRDRKNVYCDESDISTLHMYRVSRSNTICSAKTDSFVRTHMRDLTTGADSTVKDVGKKTKDNTPITSIPFLGEAGRQDYKFFSLNTQMRFLQGDLTGVHESINTKLLFNGNQVLQFTVNPVPGSGIQLSGGLYDGYLSDFYYEMVDTNQTTSYGYYVNALEYYNNTTGITSVNSLRLDIVSKWKDVTDKKYVFNIISKSTDNGYIEFNTAKINSIISRAILKADATEVISDTGQLEDNRFIPYLEQGISYDEVTIPLEFLTDPLVISIPSEYNITSNSLITRFSESESKYKQIKQDSTTPPSPDVKTIDVVNPSKNMFANWFKFQNGELRYVGNASKVTPYFVDRRNKSTWSGAIEVVTVELDGTPSTTV